MFIFSMKLSFIFPILFILGGVLSMPFGEEGAGDDTLTQTPSAGVLVGSHHSQGEKCRYSTFRRGKRDPCGLREYARECSPKGPCAFNGYDGYSPVIGNPYYFVQCGAGNISHCQPCAPGTKWNQHLLTCIRANHVNFGGVPFTPNGEKGAGDDTPTQASVVYQTPTEGIPINEDQTPAEVTPAVEDQTPAEVTPVVQDLTPEEGLPVESQTQSEGVLPGNDHNHGKKCHFSTFKREKGDPCGLRNYVRECNPKGPCAFNGYNGYLPVIANPYYFVQCGAGSTSHCQACAPGTKWSQHLLICVYAN